MRLGAGGGRRAAPPGSPSAVATSRSSRWAWAMCSRCPLRRYVARFARIARRLRARSSHQETDAMHIGTLRKNRGPRRGSLRAARPRRFREMCVDNPREGVFRSLSIHYLRVRLVSKQRIQAISSSPAGHDARPGLAGTGRAVGEQQPGRPRVMCSMESMTKRRQRLAGAQPAAVPAAADAGEARRRHAASADPAPRGRTPATKLVCPITWNASQSYMERLVPATTRLSLPPVGYV